MRFGNLQVLDSINLDIPQGSKTVIIGPSGGGKSTLLRCIN
ncbi:MAG: ATP-binding cassette domain-containing protein, partial [Sphaerochaetaceae bacterium]